MSRSAFVEQLALKKPKQQSRREATADEGGRSRKSKLFGGHVDLSVWFRIAKPLAPQANAERVPDEKLKESFSSAKALLEGEMASAQRGGGSGDRKMLQNMLRAGTLSDKVAAMTLAVQDSPLHHLEQLSALTALANKKSQRESGMAIEALTDLFVNNLLPDRKLRYYRDQLHAELRHLSEK